MVLAVDIGNTNIVVGCFDDAKVLFVERISTNLKQTVFEYAMSFKMVLDIHGIDYSQIEGGMISSVVPSVTYMMQEAMEKIIGKTPMIVGPGTKTGLKILIDNPAQLGSDLVIAAVASIKQYPLPVVMIDLGTATTFSVVDKNKGFRGVVIIPGVQTSLDGMLERTSQLPKISIDVPKNVIGTNTIDSMKSGIIYSTASSIDGVVEKIEEELGESCTVIATGGIANAIIPYCKKDIIIDDELLLKGLMIIYNKNK